MRANILYFSAMPWCVYFSVLFFSSRLECNIVRLLCCFRKKSYLDLCLGFHDIRLKYQTQKQPTTSNINSIFLYFFFLTFSAQENVDSVLHYYTETGRENKTERKTCLIARVWQVINPRSNVTQSRPGSSEGLEL